MKDSLKIWLATFVLLQVIGFVVQAQEESSDYNPFVPENLNKLFEDSVVASSYRYYRVRGDQNYQDSSTFVWYVKKGTFGIYDSMKDEWTQLAMGSILELKGKTIITENNDTLLNASDVWVKWDKDASDSTGYVAVYERSKSFCILDQVITGFKLNIVAPPEAWFADSSQGVCANDQYHVEIVFKNLYPKYYPYVLYYTYPDYNGVSQDGGMLVVTEDMLTANINGTYSYLLELNSLHDADGTYTLKLDKLRDNKGSDGDLPDKPEQNKHKELKLNVYHLPKNQGMTME